MLPLEDKDDLFENVIKPVTDHIDSVMGEHYERERASAGRELLDPAGEEEDVNAVLALLRYYYRNRQVCSILFSHREHPAVAAFFDRLIGQIDAQGKAVAALIREGIGEGTARKSETKAAMRKCRNLRQIQSTGSLIYRLIWSFI